MGKCLEKDAAQRYATASELLKDLRALERTSLSGTVDLGQTVAPPQRRIWRQPRTLAIVVALVAISTTAILVWGARPSGGPAGATVAEATRAPVAAGAVRAR